MVGPFRFSISLECSGGDKLYTYSGSIVALKRAVFKQVISRMIRLYERDCPVQYY